MTESSQPIPESERIRELEALLARAEKTRARTDRELRQVRRRAERSENLWVQSKTAMLRTHTELVEARERAERAAEIKGQFLANMSHELRTPMNGILGALDLLRASSLETEQVELCEIVSRSGESLLELLNDILDFSKIDAGHLQLEIVPFSLRNLLADLIELQGVVANRLGLDLRLEVSEDVPPFVAGDPVRIRQALLNLLSNALKFTERGSVVLKVEQSAPTRTSFRVQDSGIGMDRSVCENIFEAFTQADSTTTRKFGGTGLGLAITRRIVESMDGWIRVQSELGTGSTFELEIELPATRETTCLEEGRQPLNQPTSKVQGNRRFLVVDDDPINRLIARKMLDQLGAVIDEASNGRQAVELVARYRYEAVLMDGSMPEMDGFAATRAIRELAEPAASTYIIAVTALAMRGDRERCLEAGMDDYLSKPIRAGDLAEALERRPPQSESAA